MKINERQTLLKVIAGAIVGLFLLDWIVISPATASWHAQTERIAALREKVQRGRQLVEREKTIRGRWADAVRVNLPKDPSTAENDVFKAVGRWARESQISFTSLTPQPRQPHDEGFETFECRMTATGTQATLSRFIYELEVDPMPVNFEECEITTRDPRGAQLTMTARFSFLRLPDTNIKAAASGARR